MTDQGESALHRYLLETCGDRHCWTVTTPAAMGELEQPAKSLLITVVVLGKRSYQPILDVLKLSGRYRVLSYDPSRTSIDVAARAA